MASKNDPTKIPRSGETVDQNFTLSAGKDNSGDVFLNNLSNVNIEKLSITTTRNSNEALNDVSELQVWFREVEQQIREADSPGL